MEISFKQDRLIDYFLVFLLLAVSGMPFFNGDIPLVIVLSIAFLFFVIRREGLHIFFFFVLFSFVLLVLAHSLRESFFPSTTYVGLVIKISLGYFIISLLKRNFVEYYIKIIVFFSLVSFIFFTPLLISKSFDSIFNSIGIYPPFESVGRDKSLIVYHLNLLRPDGLYRNCGPFWEPAAFGGYLLLALMLNLSNTGKLLERKNTILIITAISTFSTTVFVLLCFIIFFYVLANQKVIFQILSIPVLAVIFYLCFVNIPFLHDKIMEEIEKGDKTQAMKEYETGHSRLSSAIADYEDFIKYPVLGRGMFPTTFYDVNDIKTRHNGLSKHIAQFGILGAGLYFLSVFLSMRKVVIYSPLKKFMGIIFFLVILGMGISEAYFEKPFFWALVFLHLVYNSSLYNKEFNNDIDKVTYA